MIAIVDYEVGNINAVANMLRRLGIPCVITAKPCEIEKADRIILPGNGAFDSCMKNLRSSGLIPLIEKKVISERTPLLGICVGAQMLGIDSAEGREAGLGWIDMHVRRFPEQANLKIPHMGWNQVKPLKVDHGLSRGIFEDARFYFVHSYYMEPNDPSEVLFKSTYGIDFASGVCHDNIMGLQFHPEKSHRFGKQLLTAFAKGL